MKDYLEKKNERNQETLAKMKELRKKEIESNGENAELFTEVICELSYRVAEKPAFGEKKLCPKCESPIPHADYDHYCGFCGQFINKGSV